MATETVNHADSTLEYQPNRTLGRSGYESPPADRMEEKIGHLDALLMFISMSAREGDDGGGFFACNNEIQATVLDLASTLATDIHELHSQLSIAGYNKSQQATH